MNFLPIVQDLVESILIMNSDFSFKANRREHRENKEIHIFISKPEAIYRDISVNRKEVIYHETDLTARSRC
jgi:hypothetical protein